MSVSAHKHGKNLAKMIGGGQRFVSAVVTTGNSMSDAEETVVAVYPEVFNGMGGGMMAAIMQGAQVFEFEHSDEDLAEELAAALNYFAEKE